ncbi:MAG: hypothetical protein H6719_17945 [Sandaracinaceae bacterium]|nr:hypothetical protein [Sandaracinaceae bacterium]
MKTRLFLAATILGIASPALAQDLAESPSLICLDDLDVERASDVARQVAPRARVYAHHESNCLVVVGHAERVAMMRDLLAELEQRARARSTR